MFWRIRLKLAVWYACAVAITLAAAALAIYLIVQEQLDNQISASIDQAQTQLQGGSSPISAPTVLGREQSEAELAQVVSSNVFFVRTTRSGQVLSNPRGIRLEGIPFANLAAAAGDGTHWANITADDDRYRIKTVLVAASATEPASYLHIGEGLNARDHELATLATVLIIGGIAALLVSGVGGLWLAGRALVPIRSSFETQRRFVADAAHELRTPLAALRANTERLDRRLAQTTLASVPEIEAIDHGGRRMSRLVDDLLTLARADEGQLQLQPEHINLDGLLTEVVGEIDALAAIKGVRIDADLAPAELAADRQRLRQVVVILLDNAIRHSPRGGTVRVRSRLEGRRAVFSIRDDGPGIAAEQQRHIFERFYQADAARSDGTGVGLGLAIARSLVDAHRGSISVQSAPGAGTTMTVRLPALRE